MALPVSAAGMAAVVARPHLWPTALRQVLRLAPAGWWRRWPPVPAPDPGYLAFRLETAYGAADRPPTAADLVAWLEWCRHQGRAGG